MPDPQTFAVLPWLPSHASMASTWSSRTASAIAPAPRTWLKDMIARAAERGFASRPHSSRSSILVQERRAGKWEPGDSTGIYAENGFNLQGRFLTDMTRTLRAMGMLPEMVYHEGGPGQQEISIRHAQRSWRADHQISCATPCAAWRSSMATTPASRPSRFPGRLAAARTSTSACGTRRPNAT